MEYERHGAHCCGISHVYGFDNATPDDLAEIIQLHDTGHDHGTPGNRLLEAVLTDRQLDPREEGDRRVTRAVRDAGGWAAILAGHGFTLHTRFQNSNTQHYCNVFHRVVTREPLEGLTWWPPVVTAAPVAAPTNGETPWPQTGAIRIPADWVNHPDDIVEMTDGTPASVLDIRSWALDGWLVRVQCAAVGTWWYQLTDGRFHGNNNRRGIRNIVREVAPAPAPEPEAVETPQETVWSEEYLTTDIARVGLRVQYRHHLPVSSPRWHNLVGVIVYATNVYICVRWENSQEPECTFPMNRFVWDTSQTPEARDEDPLPVIEAQSGAVEERAPVVERRTEYYAIRRGGTREGPFTTEEQARQRWSRVRQYVRVDIVTTDGVSESEEMFIAA